MLKDHDQKWKMEDEEGLRAMGKTQKLRKQHGNRNNKFGCQVIGRTFWWFAALLQVEGRVVKTDCFKEEKIGGKQLMTARADIGFVF
jgi:hypothetical protein